MKRSGVAGSEIVSSLVENSATWAQKTEFAQQKYILKKEKKYLPRMRVMRASALTINEVYWHKNPKAIGGLRVDALAQLLSRANVYS